MLTDNLACGIHLSEVAPLTGPFHPLVEGNFPEPTLNAWVTAGSVMDDGEGVTLTPTFFGCNMDASGFGHAGRYP